MSTEIKLLTCRWRAAHSFLPLCCLGAALFLLSGCTKPESSSSSSAPIIVPQSFEFQSDSGVAVILVEGGRFELGSGHGDEAPRVSVTLSPFVMDKFEVRQSELAALMLPDASHFKGSDRPVEMIRWSEAALVCNSRSLAEGLEPCYDEDTFACRFEATGYRLPTEAEWEYAARAGDAAPHAPGREVPQLNRLACYAGNSNGETLNVGSKAANALGFHDLLGNVAEWCQDVYAEDAYALASQQDPRGPEQGEFRVLRGGSWKMEAGNLRITARYKDEPGIDDACFAQDSYGFRMVRRPTASELERLSPALPTTPSSAASSQP